MLFFYLRNFSRSMFFFFVICCPAAFSDITDLGYLDAIAQSTHWALSEPH